MGYKVTKIPLSKIIRTKASIVRIEDAVQRTHTLIIQVYQFLRLWILSQDEDDIPEITEGIIHMCFKALTVKSAGPPPKGTNGYYYNKFLKFFDEVYSGLGYKKIKKVNLSATIGYACVQIKTAIENNVKFHYLDHIRKFVNSTFKPVFKITVSYISGTKKEKKNVNKSFLAHLTAIKNDVLNRTLKSPPQYHSWIKRVGQHIRPNTFTIEDLKVNPQNYLKYMLRMSRELEKSNKAQFQFFPLRCNIIPKHITLDTKSLVELFSEQKAESVSKIVKIRDRVWNSIFRINYKAFRRKNYTFNYMITTNGYDASILLIPSNKRGENDENNRNRVNASIRARQLYKGKTAEEVQEIKDDNKQTKKEKAKEKIRETITSKKKKPLVRAEFPYLNELDENELQFIRDSPVGFIDLGRLRPIVMGNKHNNKCFVFTNGENLRSTKRSQYAQKMHKLRKKTDILTIEKDLSKHNFKTCNIIKFTKSIKCKNELLNTLVPLYSQTKFRQYKWYSYINKNRTEDNLCNRMKAFLLDQETDKSIPPILIIGDWSIGQQMRGVIPTPGLGLKRRLLKSFKHVYSEDEFRTSILHHKTHERCKNLYLPDKNKKSRKIHSVLTYKMENTRTGCINRDKNAVQNIKMLSTCFLNQQPRPERFRRGVKIK